MSYEQLKPHWAPAKPDVTAEQVALVRTTFDGIASGTSKSFKAQSEFSDPLIHLASVFYSRLFEIAPEVRPLFRRPVTEQGGMLMKTLTLSIKMLDDLPTLVPRLQALAARHVRYGSTIAQYGAVGEALVWALTHVAGDAIMTSAAQGAWIEVYATMISVMIPAQLEADRKAQEKAEASAAAGEGAVTISG